MKKNIITLLVVIALVSAPAMAGVWVKQSSASGDAGKGCYLVTFNTISYGVNQLIGTGVVSGSTFSGFLKFTANPQNITAPQSFTATKLIECTSGNCVWTYAGTSSAYNGPSNYGGVVSVSDFPIISAQPIGCW